MRLYFAGNYSGVTTERLKELGVEYKLYSFYSERSRIRDWGSKGLLLDSGAYTASTKGVVIDTDELIEFINEVKPENAIQLDVIGDAEASWKNYLYMDKKCEVLPVIHSNYTAKQIKRVLTSDADFICLGAINFLPVPKVMEWLDYLFTFPEIRGKKIHLLGIMSKKILTRYPVFSSDSSSALSAVRYPASDMLSKYRQKTKHYTDLYVEPIQDQLEMQAQLTDLWHRKGIKF